MFRNEVLVNQRAKGSAHVLGKIEIFHAHRQPVKGPQRFTLQNGVFGFFRLFTSAIVSGGDDCVDGGIHRFDAFDAGLEQLDRRQLPGADQAARFDCR